MKYFEIYVMYICISKKLGRSIKKKILTFLLTYYQPGQLLEAFIIKYVKENYFCILLQSTGHYAPWWELIFWGFWSRSFILVREMRIQCIFEEKIDSLWNIWKRCSRLETQFHIEWKSKTKNGNFLHYEQVRAGQLEDM